MISTVPQAAKILGVHPNTIYNYISKGRIVAWKGPHGWEVLQSSVELLANDQYKHTSQLEQIFQAVHASKHLVNEFNTPLAITLLHGKETIKTLVRNETYKRMIGWPEQVLAQMTPQEIIHPDDWPMIEEESRIMQPFQKNYLDFRLRRSDFRYVWVKTSILVAPLDQGVNLGITKMTRI